MSNDLSRDIDRGYRFGPIFNGNFARTRLILMHDRYIPNMLSEGRLNRRLQEIDISIWQSIFHAISEVFSKNNESLEYLVDSMPVEVCMNIRSYRCRLLTGKQFIGFCKAKKKFYYGFKFLCTSILKHF